MIFKKGKRCILHVCISWKNSYNLFEMRHPYIFENITDGKHVLKNTATTYTVVLNKLSIGFLTKKGVTPLKLPYANFGILKTTYILLLLFFLTCRMTFLLWNKTYLNRNVLMLQSLNCLKFINSKHVGTRQELSLSILILMNLYYLFIYFPNFRF